MSTHDDTVLEDFLEALAEADERSRQILEGVDIAALPRELLKGRTVKDVAWLVLNADRFRGEA